jgi:hypothetical protein
MDLGVGKNLKMRDVAKKCLRLLVGDGKNFYLWLDWWHLDGILLEQYGYRVIYDARSKIDAKLATVIHDREWNWPAARSEALVNVQSKLPLVQIGEEDKAAWVPSKKECYSSRDTWEAIGSRKPIVEWWKLVWFSLAIPKQAFHSLACYL